MLEAIMHQRIPLAEACDVLVVGAGSAGCCAALAAARGGAGKVMLIERYGFLGGASTQVLDTFYGFFTPGEHPRKVVGGIPDEVVAGLDQASGILLRPNTYGAGIGISYNPERLKWLWETMLGRAGVQMLMHAQVIDVETGSDGAILGVVLATKQGLRRVAAKRYIDASGDADLCHWAGVPYEKAGELDPAQTLTTTFRMCNVDLERFEKECGKRELMRRMAEAVDRGAWPLARRKGSFHPMALRNCIATVAVRVEDVDPTDAVQMTRAEIEGRRQAFVFEDFLRACIPGYEEARIVALSTQIGVRETRRVYGEYRLTREDCLALRRFDDAVLLCGAPLEDHRPAEGGAEETAWEYMPDGGAYQAPYRTLVARGRDELWIAGRCFSATHDAHASCRSMGQTMSMGQAAGAAAALSLRRDCGARGVPIDELRGTLSAWGAILDEPRPMTGASWLDSWRGATA